MSDSEETSQEEAKVTAREVEVVTHMADGLTTAQIAETLGISKDTVECHRHNIIKKTGCRNAAHVVATFLRCAVIT